MNFFESKRFKEIAKNILKRSFKRNKGVDWDKYVPTKKVSFPKHLWDELWDFLKVEMKDHYAWRSKMNKINWKKDGQVAINMFWDHYTKHVIMEESRIDRDIFQRQDYVLFKDIVDRITQVKGTAKEACLNKVLEAITYEWKELEKIPNIPPYGPWRDDYQGDAPPDIPNIVIPREPTFVMDKENVEHCLLDNRGYELFEILEVLVPKDRKWIANKKRWYDPTLLIQNKTHFGAAVKYFKTYQTESFINAYLWYCEEVPAEEVLPFDERISKVMERLKDLVNEENPNNEVQDSTYEGIRAYLSKVYNKVQSSTS